MNRSRTSLFSPTKIGAIILRHDYTCFWCPTNLVRQPHESIRHWRSRWVIDHVVPRAIGGPLTDYRNVVLSCVACNASKGLSERAPDERQFILLATPLAQFMCAGKVIGDSMYRWAKARRRRGKYGRCVRNTRRKR